MKSLAVFFVSCCMVFLSATLFLNELPWNLPNSTKEACMIIPLVVTFVSFILDWVEKINK